jgi:hypothetical protein
MSTPEMGKMWIETVYLQTGSGRCEEFLRPHAAYFTELRRQKARNSFTASCAQVTRRMQGRLAQVLNSGFLVAC